MSLADKVSSSSARVTAGRNNGKLARWWLSSSRAFLWRRFAPYLGTVPALFLFGGALYLLHRQVAAYDPEDVRRPSLGALVVTVRSMTGKDFAAEARTLEVWGWTAWTGTRFGTSSRMGSVKWASSGRY